MVWMHFCRTVLTSIPSVNVHQPSVLLSLQAKVLMEVYINYNNILLAIHAWLLKCHPEQSCINISIIMIIIMHASYRQNLVGNMPSVLYYIRA